MATTIKSTALDIQNIKSNLKAHLEGKREFADFNFEGSALSALLDVLAYNTHMNALQANFALNESFIGTAQLRSSLVSLSEGLGYIPDSKTAARATIRMSMNLAGLSDVPQTISVASGYQFTGTVDEIEYTFQTQETIQATDDGNGYYQFKTLDGSSDILVYEGTPRTKTFIAGSSNDTSLYIIPDKNMDIETAVVRVYESATSSTFATYTALPKATSLSAQSTIYVVKETPNGFYELSFGNGNTLGTTPAPGTKIVVSYLSTSGSTGNGAKVFEPTTKIEVTEPESGIGETRFPVISTINISVGGSDTESLDSIRRNAPFQYAAQNRMVTYADYAALALRNFSSYIDDVIAWGGEDNIKPEFGAVFLSTIFKPGLTVSTQDTVKKGIQDLAESLAVASFLVRFSDPIKTYVEFNCKFQFNPALTTLSLNTIESQVKKVIQDYFPQNTGKFGQSFRRSNLLSLIDDVSPAVLSSRADVKLQQRIYPTAGTESDFNLSFPVALAESDDVNHIVTSSTFNYKNKICLVKNALNSTKLQVFSLADNLVVVDNVGQYVPSTGDVNIVGLTVDSFVGATEQIKISAVPANQSAVVPDREYIVSYDIERLVAQGILTSATN